MRLYPWPKVVGIDEHYFGRNPTFGFREFVSLLVDYVDKSRTPMDSGGQALEMRSQPRNRGELRSKELPMKRRLKLCFTSPFLLVIAGACASQSADRQPEYYKIVEQSTPEHNNEVMAAANNIPPPPKGEEVVCEYEEVVGSHIPRKICRSKSEAERVRQETQDYLKKLQKETVDRINPTRGGSP